MKLQPLASLVFIFFPFFFFVAPPLLPLFSPPPPSLCCGGSSRACIALAVWSIVSDFQQTNWPLGIYWQQTPQRQTQSWEHGEAVGEGREGVGEGSYREGGRGGGREGAETDRETDRWKKRRRWESFDVMKQEAGRERGREKKRDQYEEGEYTPRI